jgi:hypothetical protein
MCETQKLQVGFWFWNRCLVFRKLSLVNVDLVCFRIQHVIHVFQIDQLCVFVLNWWTYFILCVQTMFYINNTAGSIIVGSPLSWDYAAVVTFNVLATNLNNPSKSKSGDELTFYLFVSIGKMSKLMRWLISAGFCVNTSRCQKVSDRNLIVKQTEVGSRILESKSHHHKRYFYRFCNNTTWLPPYNLFKIW